MAVKFHRLIVVYFFLICLQLISVEELKVKPYGHWRAGEFGSTAIIVQTGVKIPDPTNTNSINSQIYRKKYSYVDELWGCVKASLLSSIPYLLYWYYYWYL